MGADDVVVEVGPGLGSLTLALLEAVPHVTAVEIDPPLARRLPRTITEFAPGRSADLTVVGADAMTVTRADLAAAGSPDPTALVANLPYNVSVPVLLHMLAEFPTIRTVLVMVQAEVADRLAAESGSRTYGVPSVKARFFGEVRRAGSIGRTVFWPAPKVDSGLVRIDRHESPEWPVDADFRRQVFAVVDAAFLQRRKTLRAALAGWAGSAPEAERLLRAAGIDPAERGEKIGVADYVRLADAARRR